MQVPDVFSCSYVPNRMTLDRLHANLIPGIGIRVETSDNGEFEIEHVHRNGAAERNGNVYQGDMIDSINGRPVNGLKLSELGVRLP